MVRALNFIFLKSLHVALYRIATAIFKGIRTLNVTNLFRNKDTKCHKRYHTGKKPIGGPVAWKAVRQEQCSRSTCEAEIRATDEGIKEVLSLRHRCEDMHLADANQPTPVYNDNQGCVDWAKTTSTKGMRHINLKDCAIRDSVQSKDVTIHHIQGVINPSDIFTKEMKDGLSTSVPYVTLS